MKDANLAKTIQDICSERPEVGVLACMFYEKLAKLAARSPNIFISYNLLFDIAISNKGGAKVDEHDIYLAIQVLCHPKVNFLKLNYQFIDDGFDPVNISIADVIDAEDNQGLEHPYTGEIVPDYKKYVFPFFTVINFTKEGAY